MDNSLRNPIAMAHHPIGRHPQLNDNKLGRFLEKIIDKKVNQVALNVFERFIDTLCSRFYTPYCQRLAARLAQLQLPQQGAVLPKMPQVAQKVLQFMDGAPLYDRTSAQRANIKISRFMDLLTKDVVEEEDIYLDGKRVRFTDVPQGRLVFGRQHGTQEVFINDNPETSEFVMVYERETSGNLKVWCIDTTQIVKEVAMAGQVPMGEKEVFLAREIPPMPAHAPIFEPII